MALAGDRTIDKGAATKMAMGGRERRRGMSSLCLFVWKEPLHTILDLIWWRLGLFYCGLRERSENSRSYRD
jgi:hypothetical protein